MSRQYIATIITPFHDTDMTLFMETFNSVKGQTIGFENIEWIIVLHNCTQEYIDAVKALVGEAENVVLKELVNDVRSASSPRNYGMRFVTSPYIEFLDSDDSISPGTIEKCVAVMEKHHADIVSFRMAYRKQNESVQAIITDASLWNPLEEEIVLSGERLRSRELYSSFNPATHCRFFDADFLLSNQITFDDKITMAEDACYTLTCFTKAKKIVILPQFIGHYYLMNSNSAVQSMNKPAKDVLQFSYGFKKIFDLLIDADVYYNYVFLMLLSLYLNFAHHSPDFTRKDWEVLRRDMAPYAKMLTLPPGNKLLSKEEGEVMYRFIVRDILDPAPENDSTSHDEEKTLAAIIRANQDTAFGEYYGFRSILSAEGFRKTVPLYDHRSYFDLVKLHTEVGELNLVTHKKIRAYANDFNESSRRRAVPVSEETYEALGRGFINRIAGETTFLMMESMPKGMPLNDGTFYDSDIGIMVRSGISRYSLSESELLKATLTAPFSLIFLEKPVKTVYPNLLMALRNTEVTQIYAGNTWVVWNYIEMILNKGELLCRDIENGTLTLGNNVGERLRQKVMFRNSPDPERARQIREALQSENKERMLQMIWPKLKRVLGRSGGNFRFFTGKVKKYLGSAKLETDDFITPFGRLAEKTEDEGVYRLDTESGFYEFLPMTGKVSDEPVLMNELTAGRVYELICTNDDGVYRMHTNIFIRPVRVGKEELRFGECLKPLLADTSVICDGDDFEKLLGEYTGDVLHDYFCCYDRSQKRLEILIAADTGKTEETLSCELEKALMQNPEYSAARQGGLRECTVRLIDRETRAMWHDLRRVKLNAPEDCFQPVHMIENTGQIPVFSSDGRLTRF